MESESNNTKPGMAALQNMAILKQESSVFKIPKVPKKKLVKKAEVLDEEDYVEGISRIIQRDFFPDLEKLKAQNDYLEATENKDYARLQELTRKYSGNRPPTEPYNSPATFDTPGVDRPFSPSTPTTLQKQPDQQLIKEKTKDITENQTLDSFLAKHTSEDNASYERVIALEDKKRSNKLVSQFEAEVTSVLRADAALALPSIEEQADQRDRPHELDTWKYKAKNYIMYVPSGAESQRPPPKPDLRHINTRLRAPPFDHVKNKETISAIAKTQDASCTGKIGVDGVSISTEKAAGEYSYVATPSPRPGDGPDRSPLMTWGEIEGTPFRLDGGDTPLPAVGSGAAYRMLEGGARERIAMQLAEQVARRRRPTTPRVAPRTPSFRTNTERLASMSPAARKLAAKHLLSPRLRLTPNDVGVLAHASPRRVATPGRRRGAPDPAAPNRAAPNPAAPNPAAPNPAAPNTDAPADPEPAPDAPDPAATLTDDLLRINVAKRTRLKAKDFFAS